MLEVQIPVFRSGLVARRSPVALLDLNRDGQMDVLTEPYTNALYHVWLSSTRGLPDTAVPLPDGYRPLVWADFDGDGDLEAIGHKGLWLKMLQTEVTAENQVRFIEASRPPLYVQSGLARIGIGLAGDLDGDGDLDAVLGFKTGPTHLLVLSNEGPAGFTTNQTSRFPRGIPHALADCDLDGDLDLLAHTIVSAGEHAVLLYANEGTGHFTLLAQESLPPEVLAAGLLDLDGDGLPEIWVQTLSATSSAATEHTLWIYRRSGTQLVLQQKIQVNRTPDTVKSALPMAWRDFNQDGYPDLVTLEQRPTLWGETSSRLWLPRLHQNSGGGLLQPWGGFTLEDATGLSLGYPLLPADLNGKSGLDLLAVEPSKQGKILFNTRFADRSCVSLPPPARLEFRQSGSSYQVRWEPPSGLPAGYPLTYNVRVGTRPGANDVVPSQSLPDGRRLMAAPGNAGGARQLWLTLTRPPAPRLYWSVQPVDAAYRGGLFAAEQMVVISAPEFDDREPPQISEIADVVMDENETREIEFAVMDNATPSERLQVSAGAENLWLFPGQLYTAVLGPAPEEPASLRRLRLSPHPNRWGEPQVHVVAFDETGWRTARTLRVTVARRSEIPLAQVQMRLNEGFFEIVCQAYRPARWMLEQATDLAN